jgi:hypothetical protein
MGKIKIEHMWKVLTWFKRGFGSWVSYLLSLVQFLIIAYLQVQKTTILDVLFPSLVIFSIVFVSTFFPLCVVIGYWDYKKGSFPTESNVAYLNSPWCMDIAKAIRCIAQGENDEAIKILEKWTGS